ncbi:MAG TPA: AI-2E family transporter [bacterium]|nr:AI-2E family transporter [bacterium]
MNGNRPHLFIVFFFAVFLVLIFTVFLFVKPFFDSFAWAVILSLVLFPLFQAVTRLFRGRRTVAAGLITLIALTLIIIPAFFMIMKLVQQSVGLYHQAAAYLQSDAIDRLFQQAATQKHVAQAKEQLAAYGITVPSIREFLVGRLDNVGTFLFDQTRTIVLHTASFLIGAFCTVMIFFFLLRDGELFFKTLKELLPLKQEDKEYVFRTLYDTTRGVVLGMSVSALVQGASLFAGYLIVGIPNCLFWGLVTFIAAFIPIVGVGITWLPLCVYAWINFGIGKALFLLVYGYIMVSIADNFIRPYLTSEKVKIHILLLIVSIFGGLHLFGIIGLFLGPLVMATLLAFIKIYRREYVSSQ